MDTLDTYDAVLKALSMMKRLKKLEGTLLIHEGVLLQADTLLLESQEKAFVREVNALLSQYRNAGRPLGRAMLGFDGGNVMIFHANPFVMCLIYGNVEDTAKVEAAGEEFLKRWADSLGLTEKELIQRSVLDVESAKQKAKESAASEDTAESAVKVTVLPDALPGSPPAVMIAEEPVTVSQASQEPAPAAVADPGALWNAYRESVENLLAKVLGRGQSSRFLQRELTSMGISGDSYLTHNQFRPFGQALTLRVKDKAIRKQLDTELLAILEEFTK
ncbi:hypothetical protein VSU19_16290 [Verrucomicrobiales bacterium BCK34]|nr:hypothetical protein [Verrucomicrobiales bacterium BCK34]